MSPLMSFIANSIPVMLAFMAGNLLSIKGLMADCLVLLENDSMWAWGSNLNGRLCTYGQAPFKRTSSLQSGRHHQEAMHAEKARGNYCLAGW